MKAKKTREPALKLDIGFEEALMRLAQTDPREIEDAHKKVQAAQQEVEKRVEERRDSIERGARRTKYRFRI